jgi:GT2 family glycosyltransferase
VESAPRPAVSIVIPTRSAQRWPSLVRAVAAARSQTYAAAEIVVVVDHDPALFRRIRRDLGGVTVLENLYAPGAPGSRNTGAFHTSTSLIAFLDDDTVAGEHWLAGLVPAFADPRVVGGGGSIDPTWENTEPRWLPDEFRWAVGASHAGLPTTVAPVRGVSPSGMLVRRDAFLAVGGFRTRYRSTGGPDRVDAGLCARMSALTGGLWMYVPGAVIRHEVPAARSTFGFFLRRCYAQGRGTVATAGLRREGDYLRSLPKAVLRHLAAATRGRGAHHALRAGGVLAGTAAAGLGIIVEAATARRTLDIAATR